MCSSGSTPNASPANTNSPSAGSPRLIAAHLRGDAELSWQGLNFDFTGVVFDGGSFSDAKFSGGGVNFTDAKFSGSTINFENANADFHATSSAQWWSGEFEVEATACPPGDGGIGWGGGLAGGGGVGGGGGGGGGGAAGGGWSGRHT